MKEFKIRASGCGQIMTNPRSKSEKLSKTAQTFCEKWVKEQVYNRRIEFSNKYTEKGLIVEHNSIDFLINQLNLEFGIKNDDYFEDDFMHGTPDLILTDIVVDVKNSFSFETFPLFEKEIPTKDYIYQLQVYMHLTGKKNAKLVYTLMDTPINLIDKEAYWYCENNGIDPKDRPEVFDAFKAKMTYSDIDPKFKVKAFDLAYDEAVIAEIQERVKLCREYVKELTEAL